MFFFIQLVQYVRMKQLFSSFDYSLLHTGESMFKITHRILEFPMEFNITHHGHANKFHQQSLYPPSPVRFHQFLKTI